MSSQVTNHKCPACTGPLHFVGASGKLECEYCGSAYEVAEIEALYADKESAAEEASAAAAAKEAQAEALAKQKESFETYLEKDYIVNYTQTGLFNGPELEEAKMEMWYEMTNIKPELVLTGKDKTDVNILPEEPIECQALYSVLDTIIQEVLINEDADPMALVKEANAKFQADYLDEYNRKLNG